MAASTVVAFQSMVSTKEMIFCWAGPYWCCAVYSEQRLSWHISSLYKTLGPTAHSERVGRVCGPQSGEAFTAHFSLMSLY